MKALLQTGSSGRVPSPPEKRFLITYDLPTIQRLLGHGDIKTTMIYVQTVPSRTLKTARSPLDLDSRRGEGSPQVP